MLKLIKGLSRLNYYLGMLSGFLILIVSFIIVFEVFMRYFFNSPTIWAHDVSRYLLLCIILFSAALTLQEDGHINVDFFLMRVKAAVKKAFSLLAYLFSIGYCGVLLWKTIGLFLKAYQMNLKTIGNIMIPSTWLYSVMILGASLLCIVLIIKIYENVSGKPLFTSIHNRQNN